jgi:hypothetical protein
MQTSQKGYLPKCTNVAFDSFFLFSIPKTFSAGETPMATTVILPHGTSIDLDAVKVIRAVGEKESDGFNHRMAARPGGTGIISDSRWTVALEVMGEKGITTRYTRDPDADRNGPLTVAKMVAALGDAGRRFQVVDGGTAAVDVNAKAIAIRPLAAREGSDNLAVVYIAGASGNGLFVANDVEGIRKELGPRAAHLSQIGQEGYIDRSKIERVGAFDPDKELHEGQTRYVTSVKLAGIGRPQFFQADAATITGSTVVDTRAALSATRPPERTAGPAGRKAGQGTP